MGDVTPDSRLAGALLERLDPLPQVGFVDGVLAEQLSIARNGGVDPSFRFAAAGLRKRLAILPRARELRSFGSARLRLPADEEPGCGFPVFALPAGGRPAV